MTEKLEIKEQNGENTTYNINNLNIYKRNIIILPQVKSMDIISPSQSMEHRKTNTFMDLQSMNSKVFVNEPEINSSNMENLENYQRIRKYSKHHSQGRIEPSEIYTPKTRPFSKERLNYQSTSKLEGNSSSNYISSMNNQNKKIEEIKEIISKKITQSPQNKPYLIKLIKTEANSKTDQKISAPRKKSNAMEERHIKLKKKSCIQKKRKNFHRKSTDNSDQRKVKSKSREREKSSDCNMPFGKIRKFSEETKAEKQSNINNTAKKDEKIDITKVDSGEQIYTNMKSKEILEDSEKIEILQKNNKNRFSTLKRAKELLNKMKELSKSSPESARLIQRTIGKPKREFIHFTQEKSIHTSRSSKRNIHLPQAHSKGLSSTKDTQTISPLDTKRKFYYNFLTRTKFPQIDTHTPSIPSIHTAHITPNQYHPNQSNQSIPHQSIQHCAHQYDKQNTLPPSAHEYASYAYVLTIPHKSSNYTNQIHISSQPLNPNYKIHSLSHQKLPPSFKNPRIPLQKMHRSVSQTFVIKDNSNDFNEFDQCFKVKPCPHSRKLSAIDPNKDKEQEPGISKLKYLPHSPKDANDNDGGVSSHIRAKEINKLRNILSSNYSRVANRNANQYKTENNFSRNCNSVSRSRNTDSLPGRRKVGSDLQFLVKFQDSSMPKQEKTGTQLKRGFRSYKADSNSMCGLELNVNSIPNVSYTNEDLTVTNSPRKIEKESAEPNKYCQSERKYWRKRGKSIPHNLVDADVGADSQELQLQPQQKQDKEKGFEYDWDACDKYITNPKTEQQYFTPNKIILPRFCVKMKKKDNSQNDSLNSPQKKLKIFTIDALNDDQKDGKQIFETRRIRKSISFLSDMVDESHLINGSSGLMQEKEKNDGFNSHKNSVSDLNRKGRRTEKRGSSFCVWKYRREEKDEKGVERELRNNRKLRGKENGKREEEEKGEDDNKEKTERLREKNDKKDLNYEHLEKLMLGMKTKNIFNLINNPRLKDLQKKEKSRNTGSACTFTNIEEAKQLETKGIYQFFYKKQAKNQYYTKPNTQSSQLNKYSTNQFIQY